MLGDYTGFGKDGRHNYKRDYKINRLLTTKERQLQLKQKQRNSFEILDALSVVKINSTYLELVDRWYSVKGSAVWTASLALVVSSFLFGIVLWVSFFCDKCERNNNSDFPLWGVAVILIPIILPLIWVGIRGVRFDAFRTTHYPIRLNRNQRKVHVFMPRDTVLTASWDKLFICLGENKLPMFDDSVDIRAHVLSDDGRIVKDTFTLGYIYMGNKESTLRLWEYIRRYMEESDGVKQCFDCTGLCMPIDGRREGFVFGVIRTFAVAARWPIAQLLGSPLFALTAWGRWFAMITSKLPHWPAEVEAACEITADDPYRKDWRSNGSYSFNERWWPLICFTGGTGVLVLGLVELINALLSA